MARPHVFTVLALALLADVSCAPAPALRSEGFVTNAIGDRLYYRVVGAGPDTVVVVHGGPGLHARYLEPALAALTGEHVLIYYDQRGRGLSDFPRDSLSLSARADIADLETIRTSFHLQRLRLVGHGWGAGLAALYAMEHPAHIERLLLISPMVPRAEYLWGLGFQRAAGRDTSGLVGLDAARLAKSDRNDPVGFCRRYWGAYLSPAPVRDRGVIARLGPAMCSGPRAALTRVELINRRVTGSLGAWDWVDRLREIQAPALVIQGAGPRTGERDEAGTWLGSAREWSANLHDARLLVTGSVPQFPWLDAASDFDAATRAFLSGAWPPGAHRIDHTDSLRARAPARDRTVTPSSLVGRPSND